MAYQGAPLPEWLQDFYNRNDPVAPVGPVSPVSPVQRSATPSYTRRYPSPFVPLPQNGDGYSPTASELDLNQVDLPDNIAYDLLQTVAGQLPYSQFVTPAIDLATKGYDYVTGPDSPKSLGAVGTGLWSSAMEMVDEAEAELDTFLDNPVDTVGGYLGFDMDSQDTSTPFSNVGEVSKNIGAGAGLSSFLTGPAGMAVEGVAGLFETSALNDVLRSMNVEPLDVFDVAYAALSPSGTLRDEAMESFDKGIMSGDIYDSPWSRAAAVGSDSWNQMEESFDRQNNFNESMDAWEAQNAPTQDTINPSFNSIIQNALNTPVAPNPAPVTSAPLAPVAPSQGNSGGGGGYSSGDFDDGNSGAGDTGGGYSDESGYGGESQDSDW